MTKRPSLFVQKNAAVAQEPASELMAEAAAKSDAPKPASRIGKRVLSVYLDPLAWKQLRQLALDSETTTQALGEEAVNLLFAKHGINRSA
jgi:hypothetical protein